MRRNGGATIPIAGSRGGLGASTPTAFIVLDQPGVTVGLRSRLLEAFFLFGLGLRGRRRSQRLGCVVGVMGFD